MNKKTALLREVAEQNRALQTQLAELARERALIDAITGSMNEGLLLLDTEGRILSANHSIRALLNIGGDIAGKNVIEVVRHVELIQHIEAAKAGESSDAALTLTGKVYQCLFRPTPDGILVLFLDITEKFNAEKRRREFSANVSHELKTPLTAVSGYAELIENGLMQQADIPAAAGKIRREAGRLILLIEDIIRLSELDEMGAPPVFEEVDLCETARAAADTLLQKAQDAGVALGLPEGAVIASANADMMFELFFNLLDNGIKYNKPGGRVDVTVMRGADSIKITVADTGLGIAPQYLDRIFERFYRVDKSRAKTVDGTGLGLSIVKHIAAVHGGTIRADSEPGAGTTMTVEMNV